MTTKEKILHEALSLFAEKGYDAVYVGDIADAVGIKAPSLYKHYKSKQEIFDSCVEVFSKRRTIFLPPSVLSHMPALFFAFRSRERSRR